MAATPTRSVRVADRLPEFPWDTLAPAAATAREHPGGMVDLSVGTPVDPTPEHVQRALTDAADAPGYPTVWGTPQLREAVAAWFERTRRVPGLNPDGVMPTIGSKELVAWLPALLGLGHGDTVVFPEIAYPTYDVGARLVGARPFPTDALSRLGPERAQLIWVNSPSNPTGRVLGVEHLRKVVAWARERGAVVASDECYAQLDWRTGEEREDGNVPSILDPRVTDGDLTGLLAVYSMSKQSNLAGYRAAFVAGDPALVRELVAVRKHLGMMMPAPVQAALIAACTDDAHVIEQRRRYGARRELLSAALVEAGFRIDHSQAGLYLWSSRLDAAGQDEDCWTTVDWLAERGILAAPGAFYGAAGQRHVRIALTATDDAIQAAAERLAG